MKLYKLLITILICPGILCFVNTAAKAQCFTNYTLTPTSTPGPNNTFCGPVSLVMSGSQFSSVSYQLTIGGVNYGSPIHGNGSPITFGPIDINHGGTCLIYASQSGSQCQPTIIASTQVFFYQMPDASITASSASTGVCANSPVTLTAYANSNVTYQWKNNGVNISNANTATYVVTQGGQYSLQLSNACYSPSPIVYPTVFVTTPPIGTMSSISPGIQQYTLANLPATFSATAANANNYAWTISQPSAGTITGTGSTGTMHWQGTYTGELTISVTATGCGSPVTNSLTINILPDNSQAYTTQAENFINYVKETDVRVQNAITSADVETVAMGNKNVIYTYYNGLGAPEQKVMRMASSNNTLDVVQQFENDEFGRESVKYLPYTAATADGSYHPYAVAELEAFYSPSAPGAPNLATTPFPFAETDFEPSSLNRVVERGAPGDVWQLTGKPTATSPGHTVRADVTINDLSTFNPADKLGSKKVILYTTAIDGSTLKQTLSGTTSTLYNPGTLLVNITKDENWVAAKGVLGTIEEYKDINGRVVLKRTYNPNNINAANTDELSTYYVYDDFGNLAFVLPPLASPDAGNISQTTLDNLCYQYRYDQKQRLVQKKLPGKGWEFIVYNNIDEIVMTQDANQRNKGVNPQQWIFTKYDALGRVALSGLYIYPGSTGDSNVSAPGLTYLQALQTLYQNTTNPLWESRDNTTTTGYNNLSDPVGTTGYTFYKINYYDDYTAPTGKVPSGFAFTSASKMTRGLPTITLTDILTTSSMLCEVSYYDDYGRPWKQFNQHYLGGVLNAANYDLIINSYNFDNSMYTAQRNHYSLAGGSTPVVTLLNTYVYDLIGRQKQLLKSINGAAAIILSQTDYNEVGQVITKHLHSANNGVSFLQNTGYVYNERGWLKKINSPTSVTTTKSFGEQLYYGDNPTTGLRMYNGNIGTVKWQTLVPIGGEIPQQQQEYDYTYDALNRLINAHYTSATPADAGAYDEALTYDLMGNIASLNRWGKPSGVQQIDQLQYTYASAGKSDKLTSITDAITAFSQGQPTGTTNYTYDINGNQKTDSQKATTVAYNFLNLPQSVTQTGNSNILKFVYTADGRKLRKLYGTLTRDYVDGIEYNNGSIEFIQTEEGRAIPNGANYVYEYFLKDHLGNTRLTEKSDGLIYQLQDYYAFGMDIPISAPTSPDNRYKYNGKEWENEMSWNLYDYGARSYDPVIGRFTTIDPYSEFFPWMTNYQYGSNNPSSKIDIDGLEGIFFFEETGFNFEPLQNIAEAGGEFEGEAVSESSASQSSSIKIEWHHLIPQALKGLEMIKQAIKEGFGFDDEENLSPQEKFSRKTGLGRHGSHPKYTEAIKGQLKEAATSNPGSSASDIVRKVAANARQTIDNNPFTKINDLYGLNLLIIQPAKHLPVGQVTVGPITIIPLPKPKPKPSPPPPPPKPDCRCVLPLT